jgi:hypothetical protein
MASEIKANKISPATGTDFTLGDSGDTFTVPSGVTLTNSGTATGFGSPAYASNASATDDTVNVDASDNLQFNSGYGSTATAYGCRAWVNFNGTGTVAIRDSGNVSSITDNGTGDYTITMTTAMPDINYSICASVAPSGSNTNLMRFNICAGAGSTPPYSAPTSSEFRMRVAQNAVATESRDSELVCVSVFR